LCPNENGRRLRFARNETGDVIDKRLSSLEPRFDIPGIENDEIRIVALLPTVEQQVEVLAHLLRDAPRSDIVTMEQ